MSTALHAGRVPGRRRQRLVPTPGPRLMASLDAGMTVEQLRHHFQTAVELEHSTIPPYLCALYSMDADKNVFAYQAIQGVVMEEMLHMIQAANILTAIGGAPELYNPKFIPEYPTYLPHSDKAFLVPLQKFSPETVQDVFLKIEMPKAKAAPPQPNHYNTIGQFYLALKQALIRLGPKIFTGNPAWQVTSNDYYGGGGKLLGVYGLDHAVEGIDEIIGQGEGIDGTIEDPDRVLFGEGIEYAHYFRFNEVLLSRRYKAGDHADKPPTGAPVEVDWNSSLNMKPNPKLKDYPVGSPLWTMTMECNRTYMRILHTIQVACTGAPQQLRQAIPLMYELKYQVQALMNVPLDDGSGQHAGPSFEYAAL
jgi:Ferritin-like